MQIVDKKINLQLVGLNGNAFFLMGAFRNQAKKEGWNSEEIKAVLEEAMSGDYDYLLATLAFHCDPQDDDDEYGWEDFDEEGDED